MTDKEIIDAAKVYEKSTGFGDIVLRAKGVNSAAGIGFLEGAVWMQEQMMKDAVDADVEQEYYNPKLPLYIDTIYVDDRADLKRGDKVKLIIIKEAEK